MVRNQTVKIATALDAGVKQFGAEDVGHLVEVIGILQGQLIAAQNVAIDRGEELIKLRDAMLKEASKQRGIDSYLRVLEGKKDA